MGKQDWNTSIVLAFDVSYAVLKGLFLPASTYYHCLSLVSPALSLTFLNIIDQSLFRKFGSCSNRIRSVYTSRFLIRKCSSFRTMISAARRREL